MTSPNTTTQGAAEPIQSYLEPRPAQLLVSRCTELASRRSAVGLSRASATRSCCGATRKAKFSALEDRCPHRGARLSLGWNLGGSVACWYHGIEIDGGGTVTKVPAVSTCPLEGQKCVKSYPVEEHAGAIFLWFGDDAHKEPAPLVLPEELVGEEYASFLCMSNWKCNYQYAIDNVMDPMHGAYLHATSHSMAEGDKQADMRVRKTDTGLDVRKGRPARREFRLGRARRNRLPVDAPRDSVQEEVRPGRQLWNHRLRCSCR